MLVCRAGMAAALLAAQPGGARALPQPLACRARCRPHGSAEGGIFWKMGCPFRLPATAKRHIIRLMGIDKHSRQRIAEGCG